MIVLLLHNHIYIHALCTIITGLHGEDLDKFLATYAGESKLQGYKVGIIETKEGVKGKSKLSKLLVNIDDDSTFDCQNP